MPKRKTFKVNPMNIGPWLCWRLWVIIWENKNAHWRNLSRSHRIARGDRFKKQWRILRIYNRMPYRRKLARCSGWSESLLERCQLTCAFLRGWLSGLQQLWSATASFFPCFSTLEGWHWQAFCDHRRLCSWVRQPGAFCWASARQHGGYFEARVSSFTSRVVEASQ